MKNKKKQKRKACMYCKTNGIINNKGIVKINDVELGFGWICEKCLKDLLCEQHELYFDSLEKIEELERKIAEIYNSSSVKNAIKSILARFKNCFASCNKGFKANFLGFRDKNNKIIMTGDVLKTPCGSFGTAILDNNRPAIQSPGSLAIDYEDKNFFNQCEIVANIILSPDFYEQLEKSLTGSADIDLVVWFDNQKGEEIPEYYKDEFLRKAQGLAQAYGFDYYYSSSLRGIYKKLKSLDSDGFFKREED